MIHKKVYVEPKQMLEVMHKRQRNIKFQVPEKIIVILSGQLSPHMGGEEWGEIENFFYMKIQFSKKRDVAAVAHMGFGSPAAAIGLELLIAAGAKKIIGFGTAGAITPELASGDLMLCEKAWRDEGVSQHYLKEDNYSYPDEELLAALKSSCDKLKLKWAIGPSWTTDAIFREGIDEVRKFRDEGVLAVEMEASALFSVSRFRQVQTACLFAISDHLVDGEWAPEFVKALARYDDLMRVALDALEN